VDNRRPALVKSALGEGQVQTNTDAHLTAQLPDDDDDDDDVLMAEESHRWRHVLMVSAQQTREMYSYWLKTTHECQLT